MHLVKKNGLAVEQERAESRQGLAGVAWAGLRWFQSGLGGNAKVGRKQMRVIATLAIVGNKRLMLVSCAGGRAMAGTGVAGVATMARVRPVLVGAREVCESANQGSLADGIGRAFVVGR
jgi:hypothetical protein